MTQNGPSNSTKNKYYQIMRHTFYCQTENCREGSITSHYATSAADQVAQQSQTLSVQLNPIMAAPKQEMNNSKTSILPHNILNKLYRLPYKVYLQLLQKQS